MQGITAEEVAETFVREWVSRFGVPLTITTDQGTQFESDLFHRLMQSFDTKRTRTTAYHPQANGMIVRLHRQLKASIMCHGGDWIAALPLVLLGIRSAYKEDIKASTTEMLYGETLRLPGELIVPSSHSEAHSDPADFVSRLRQHMSDIRPVPASRHGIKTSFIFKDLGSASHVYLREDAVRRPFQPPYTGPYKILKRATDGKTLTVNIKGKTVTVTVDRVKPAYISMAAPDQPPVLTTNQQNFAPPAVVREDPPVPPTLQQSTAPLIPPNPAPYTTRSGRKVRFKVFRD